MKLKEFNLKIGYIKILEDFRINLTKEYRSKRGEYIKNLILEKGTIIQIIDMCCHNFYKKENELSVRFLIKKEQNLGFRSSWFNKKLKSPISSLEGLIFEEYELRLNENRYQKLRCLLE